MAVLISGSMPAALADVQRAVPAPAAQSSRGRLRLPARPPRRPAPAARSCRACAFSEKQNFSHCLPALERRGSRTRRELVREASSSSDAGRAIGSIASSKCTDNKVCGFCVSEAGLLTASVAGGR